MKLSKLIIKNFRGLKGDKNIINFDNSDIIFLIGHNDVGKSTFLKAYEFFTNSTQVAKKSDFYNYDENNEIEIIGEFIKESDDDSNKDFNKEPNWINNWVDKDSKKVIIKKVWNKADERFSKYTYNPNDGEKRFVQNGFGGLDTLFKKYAPTAIFINAVETPESFEKKVNDIVEKEYLKELREKYGLEYDEAIEKINVLQKKITSSDGILKYNEKISKSFNNVFPDLSLKISQKGEDGIDLAKAFKANHSVDVVKEGNDRKENITQHGHGIIRQALFNFITFLKTDTRSTKKEYLILFEEPELYMHPKASRALRKELYEVIKDSPFQILCATHSPIMIDISKPHSSLVRIVKEPDESTKTFQVGHDIFQSEENKDFVQMINRFNPYVCEAFYASEVILVEGDTEAIVFRYLLDKYYDKKETDIYVLNTGSKNNIVFYQKILTHFNIKHHVVHDIDQPKNNKNDDDNSAWTLNYRIEEQMNKSNEECGYLICKRYVHFTNFEVAHPQYKLNKKKGKPLCAYEFAKNLSLESDARCVNVIRAIVENCDIDDEIEKIEALLLATLE
ncbi:ATP-dependent nuclease [Clostridium intestinale]|uniref:AAA family ATPase n=1 Tax=Clostridium intestinale TaxID=36845 RepID=A0A7D6VLZ3_9CLOT|nr:AAA family ATPase [Clostridium intestinale]QLY78076.1 AAA family ATPase [Clostridium intestinale]